MQQQGPQLPAQRMEKHAGLLTIDLQKIAATAVRWRSKKPLNSCLSSLCVANFCRRSAVIVA